MTITHRYLTLRDEIGTIYSDQLKPLVPKHCRQHIHLLRQLDDHRCSSAQLIAIAQDLQFSREIALVISIQREFNPANDLQMNSDFKD